MDQKMKTLLDKVKTVADKTGRVASKKAGDLAQATRLNLQIFDVNTECEVLFKALGRQVYEVHCGEETDAAEMDARFEALDEKQQKLAALREQLASLKTVAPCPHCGKQCGRDDTYCSSCGAPL